MMRGRKEEKLAKKSKSMKSRKQKFRLGKGEARQIVISRPGNYEIELAGEGAEVEVLGLLLTQGKEKLKIKIRLVHRKLNTNSDALIKAVAKDGSKVELTGMIKIQKEAQKTQAFLREDVLIASTRAQAELAPNLEIEADDVSASHAATAGKIDEEQLFYLMSRGMEKETAELLIIEGFLREVVEKIKDKKVRQKMDRKVKEKVYNLNKKVVDRGG